MKQVQLGCVLFVCALLVTVFLINRRTASRAPGLPGLAWLLSKGGLAMYQLLPLERPLLFERVQVTYHALRQAHARLGTALVLFEQVAAVRSKYCKQALGTVRDMGGLAASLQASLLTLDSPAALTVGLRLRLGVLIQYTDKAAMQLVLVQSCCRRNTALASWLHQQACAYLDTVMQISQETLCELTRFAAQLSCAASDQQPESYEGGDGNINLLIPGSGQA